MHSSFPARPSALLKRAFLLGFAVAPLGVAFAQAQPPRGDPGLELQRRQEQTLDAQRERANQRPDVFGGADPQGAQAAIFPAEQPCFAIERLAWEGDSPPRSLEVLADAALGRCLGVQGLRLLQERMTQSLVAEGRVTARVLLPEQSLARGQLRLRYVSGRISAVRSENAAGSWRTVLPTWPGGEINQRDLDQALENIRRLAGQSDASIDVVPGPELGESDVLIKPGTGKRWHGYAGGDNGGIKSISRYQMNVGLTLDSPLFLYDQLSVSWNSNANRGSRDVGSRAASINYSIPFGYWTLFAGASKSRYRQTVAGFDAPIVYAGNSKQIEAGVSVVPYRGTTYKGNLSAKLYRKRSDSTINDYAIDVQRRDVVGYDISYNHRHYVDQAAIDVGGGVRNTLPYYSDAPGYVFDDPHWNGRSTVLVGNAALYLPFKLGRQSLAFQSALSWQHAKTSVLPADYFTIGNRYAVRGFNGEMTLAAESGWSVRNDLSLNLGNTGQQLYTGLDVGRVSGAAARYLAGQTLVGAVAGFRGRVPMPHLQGSYDLSLGWPLKKPDNIKTDSTTVAFTLMFDF